MRRSLIVEKLMRLEECVASDPAVEKESSNGEGAAPAIQSVKGGKRSQKSGGCKLRPKVKSEVR